MLCLRLLLSSSLYVFFFIFYFSSWQYTKSVIQYRILAAKRRAGGGSYSTPLIARPWSNNSLTSRPYALLRSSQIGVIVVLPRAAIPKSWPTSLQVRSLEEDRNRSCPFDLFEHDDRALLPLQPEVATRPKFYPFYVFCKTTQFHDVLMW